MENIAVKNDLLLSGRYQKWKMRRKDLNLTGFSDVLDDFDELEDKCCEQLLNAYKMRLKRVYDEIEFIVMCGQGVFVTFTFNDEALNRTSSVTRRRQVSRFLKSVSSRYVANIDFGKKNNREHYHAIIPNEIPLEKLQAWYKVYGTIKAIKIKPSSDPKVIAKYILKLSLHSLKESTKNSRLIYSRLNNKSTQKFLKEKAKEVEKNIMKKHCRNYSKIN